MPVTLEITVNGSADPVGRYLTWTPYQAQVRVVASDLPGPLPVLLRNAAGNVGGLYFRQAMADEGEDELALQLPVDGSPVGFLLSGEFMRPSRDDGDAVLEAVVGGQVVAQVAFMVRVRKNAETLTDGERDRFVGALAALNNNGQGVFRGFRAMHTDDTSGEAHGRDAFLPWHRAYLLDLERELQAVEPSVALHYWRFDRAAPRLFSADFLGAPAGPPEDGPGQPVKLSPGHPLETWSVDGAQGIIRHPRFADPRFSPATSAAGPVRDSDELLDSPDGRLDYAYKDVVPAENGKDGFRDIVEINPHGRAHVSFSGSIRFIDTAARDPLFFMLHCFLDRIWARWQWRETRFDGTKPTTYFYRGRFEDPGRTWLGHNLLDTMWPWNGETDRGRPPTAPRQPLLGSRVVAGPPATPTVRDLVDYQAQHSGSPCGFDYDDVPFEKRA